MPDEIRRLSKEILRDPISVEVAPRRAAPAQGVRQSLLPVTSARKRDLLAHLIENEAKGQMLVFTRTKHGANKLARHLERRGHGVTVLHGNRSQAQRTRALDAFKKKRARVMVATDIAGRGIDVDGIAHVVNYDLPHVPEDYVHRIGRTARAGATGDAFSLVCPEDRQLVRAIESLIGCSIERRSVLDFAVGADAPPRSPAQDGRRFQKRAGSGQRGQRPAKRRNFSNRPKRNARSSEALPPSRLGSGWRGRGSRRQAV